MIDFEPIVQRDQRIWRRTWILIGGITLCVGLVAARELRVVRLRYQIPAPGTNTIEAVNLILAVPQDPVRYANSKRDRMKWVWQNEPGVNAWAVWFWQNNEWRFGFYTLTNSCVITNNGGTGNFQPFWITRQDIEGNPKLQDVKKLLPKPL